MIQFIIIDIIQDTKLEIFVDFSVPKQDSFLKTVQPSRSPHFSAIHVVL